jgi:hypothetical protein
MAQAFITGAAAAGNTRLGLELVELSALQAAHGRDALLASLERAVAFKRWRAQDVASILTAGTGLPQPRHAGDRLPVDLPAVPTRALSSYALATISGAALWAPRRHRPAASAASTRLSGLSEGTGRTVAMPTLTVSQAPTGDAECSPTSTTS